MTTLVTGAAGFLGSHVARLLVARGDNVRLLLRPTSSTRLLDGLPAGRVQRVAGDLRDAASLDAAVDGVESVYHVAADYRLWARAPREIYESNVDGTRNLLDAARRAGVARFVYTSTVATMAVPRGEALPDERTIASLDEMIGAYKRSKWLAEQEALRAAAAGQPVVIVNPTTPVGPGDAKPTPTGRILVDFLNGRMPAYVDTGLNFVPVEDAAAGHLLAAERGRAGERYILGGENLTLKQALDLLSGVSGRPAPRWRLPHAVALAAGYADAAVSRLLDREPQIPLEGVRMARHNMFVNTEKARLELGFSPGPVAAALERAVRWYEANRYVSGGRSERVAEVHAA
jgi:dihydroflavonol-4-reductase